MRRPIRGALPHARNPQALFAIAVAHDWRDYAFTLVTLLTVLRTRLHPLWRMAGGALAGVAGLVYAQRRRDKCPGFDAQNPR